VVRQRALPPVDELLAALAEQGVADAPAEGDPASLQGLLDLALHVAEHRKRVAFPGFTWEDPAFVAADRKLAMRVAYVRMRRGDDLAGTLRAHLPRVAGGHALLALDARETTLREFDVVHELYGRVTLFEHRAPVPESADPRVDAARERGWAKTLKEHNLLPGRSLVVLDEHQGLLLRDDAFARLLGVLLLPPTGLVTLLWNPFVEAGRNDSELQYWLGWGEGSGRSSEWREVVEYRGED
jgi:hypothetical protein